MLVAAQLYVGVHIRLAVICLYQGDDGGVLHGGVVGVMKGMAIAYRVQYYQRI